MDGDPDLGSGATKSQIRQGVMIRLRYSELTNQHPEARYATPWTNATSKRKSTCTMGQENDGGETKKAAYGRFSSFVKKAKLKQEVGRSL